MSETQKFSGWLRFYNDILTDPKIQKLSLLQYHFLTSCWVMANLNDGWLPPIEDIAWSWKRRKAVVSTLLKEMKDAGLLDEIDGRFTPHNWSGRQFKSDHNGAERMSKFRHARRTRDQRVTDSEHKSFPQITHEIQATNSKHSETLNARDVTRDNGVTAPETETETEVKAAAVELRSSAPPPPKISQPAELPPPVRGGSADVSLKEQEIVATCAPVTFRLGSPLTPGIIGSILQNLNGAPVSFLADRIKERGQTAKTLGFLIELAKDACEQSRNGSRKPPKAFDPLGDKDYVPSWRMA